jgi:hypothetical protein
MINNKIIMDFALFLLMIVCVFVVIFLIYYKYNASFNKGSNAQYLIATRKRPRSISRPKPPSQSSSRPKSLKSLSIEVNGNIRKDNAKLTSKHVNFQIENSNNKSRNILNHNYLIKILNEKINELKEKKNKNQFNTNGNVQIPIIEKLLELFNLKNTNNFDDLHNIINEKISELESQKLAETNPFIIAKVKKELKILQDLKDENSLDNANL